MAPVILLCTVIIKLNVLEFPEIELPYTDGLVKVSAKSISKLEDFHQKLLRKT